VDSTGLREPRKSFFVENLRARLEPVEVFVEVGGGGGRGGGPGVGRSGVGRG